MRVITSSTIQVRKMLYSVPFRLSAAPDDFSSRRTTTYIRGISDSVSFDKDEPTTRGR
ncbi:hypothetical protein [Tepidiphilus succinatimandens]|uniref:hypothetical protein n=1 Tax=Tepidiphilus succinatimandens TaxID=224436 RepID=UPI0014777D8B|nr:hypothetical protein [Tepidiphilus succinatimandens]